MDLISSLAWERWLCNLETVIRCTKNGSYHLLVQVCRPSSTSWATNGCGWWCGWLPWRRWWATSPCWVADAVLGTTTRCSPFSYVTWQVRTQGGKQEKGVFGDEGTLYIRNVVPSTDFFKSSEKLSFLNCDLFLVLFFCVSYQWRTSLVSPLKVIRLSWWIT